MSVDEILMHRTRIGNRDWGGWKMGGKPSVDLPFEAEEAIFVRAATPPAGDLVGRLLAPMTMSQFFNKADLYAEAMKQRAEAASALQALQSMGVTEEMRTLAENAGAAMDAGMMHTARSAIRALTAALTAQERG